MRYVASHAVTRQKCFPRKASEMSSNSRAAVRSNFVLGAAERKRNVRWAGEETHLWSPVFDVKAGIVISPSVFPKNKWKKVAVTEREFSGKLLERNRPGVLVCAARILTNRVVWCLGSLVPKESWSGGGWNAQIHRGALSINSLFSLLSSLLHTNTEPHVFGHFAHFFYAVNTRDVPPWQPVLVNDVGVHIKVPPVFSHSWNPQLRSVCHPHLLGRGVFGILKSNNQIGSVCWRLTCTFKF